MSKIAQKMIKVLTVGYIHEYGQAHGPLLTPFSEKVEVIGRMVRRGEKVSEVLADGKEVVLTEANFDKDNTGTGVVPEPPTPGDGGDTEESGTENPEGDSGTPDGGDQEPEAASVQQANVEGRSVKQGQQPSQKNQKK